MTEQLNICLHVENEPYLVIESNINQKPSNEHLFAEVWGLPTEDEKAKYPYITNKCLKHFYGRHALVDAVLYLSEQLGEPIAHKLTKKKEGGTVWL